MEKGVTSHGSAGTAMLGVGGFVLLAVSSVFGELEQVVESTATTAWCQGCGDAALPHGRRPVRVWSLASSGRPVTLLGSSACGAVRSGACARTIWSEVSDHVPRGPR